MTGLTRPLTRPTQPSTACLILASHLNILCLSTEHSSPQAITKAFQQSLPRASSFNKHVCDVVAACKTEFSGWDDYKMQIDPLMAVNCALGIDNTELKRAVKTLEDAQLNLRCVRDDYLTRLQRSVYHVDFVRI